MKLIIPCEYARSGCNAPEGECNGACMTDMKKTFPFFRSCGHEVKGSHICGNTVVGLKSSEIDAAEIRRLHALCEEQKRLLERARDAFVNIGEYWNRNQNEGAMADACWHAINTSDAEASVIANHLRQQEGEKHD